MLSFALGDLTVTLRHRRRNRIQISNQLQEGIVHYGRVSGEDALKFTGEQYHEWSAADKTSSQLNTRLTAGWDPKQTQRSSTERGSNEDLIHDSTKPFMGRGSLCVTFPPWSCKVTLWTLLVSLLLLSFMATTVSSTPIMEGRSNAESESLVVPDPRNTEFVVEENIDVSIKATWTSTYENVTLEVLSDDELPDVLFRAERSPEASAKLKRSRNPEKDKNSKDKNNKDKNNKNNKDKNNKEKQKISDGDKDCSRQTLRVRVRDLDLGYDSEEWIMFHYCSGSCQQQRNNYDVTLTYLLKHKHITHSAHGRVSNHPCCRPTSYEKVAFMDIKNNWQVVTKLSAANCSCVP
ncbi:artemin [Mantella aurantiaca]